MELNLDRQSPYPYAYLAIGFLDLAMTESRLGILAGGLLIACSALLIGARKTFRDHHPVHGYKNPENHKTAGRTPRTRHIGRHDAHRAESAP